MLSLPLKKHMSKVELFTQWSALAMYLPVGVLAMCVPGLLAKPFSITSSKYGEGLIRVIGMQLAVLSLLYCIFSRVKPNIASKAMILSSTFERLVYVTSYAYVICARQLIPAPLLIILVIVDSGLSVITLIIWFGTSEEASMKNYFSLLAQLMPFKSKLNYSSFVVQFLGLAQFVLSNVFLIYPNAANHVLQLNVLHGHQQGLLLLTLLASGALGSIQCSSGGADSKACSIAVVFYRLCFSMPLLVVLTMLQQIPMGIAGYFIGLDVSNVVLIYSLSEKLCHP